ncbi:MAG: Gldg family protein [Planctomycetaceae bacterium]|nr:Gldg family protein [Planctomycetaceae bacterium]
MIRTHVILAVTKRNFSSYFSSVLGYLFIVVFCVAASVMAFNTQFFADNQANLDQLSQQFPLLLLFLIPAITMTVWADEKKLGTDELLFTLPASDVEVLIGKYFAVLGVYTVALLFSLINVVTLKYLGSPDLGLLLGSYCGYWYSGAALLAVGMFASALTSSATVAFVLGVVFCCVPVFIGTVSSALEWVLAQFGVVSSMYEFRTAVEKLSLQEQLKDFGVGVIPLSNIAYFVMLTALMLYLNLIVISRRRWQASEAGSMWLHYAARTVSLTVAFVSLLVISGIFPLRADLTSEKLFSLSDATYQTIDEIGDRKVTIQAFISPEVPGEYNDTRRRLLGLLREFDLRGGANIEVRIVNVEPFSVEAEEARALGVDPVRLQYEQDGKFEEAEIFLGAVVLSDTDDVEIPFFGKGLPIEYELTRSVRTVSQDNRLTIGVLQTDAGVISGDGRGRDWELVQELKKQYKVISVDPARKILVESTADAEQDGDSESDEKEDFDVLLAVMPSSLTDPQMNNFMEYVEAGRPVLVFEDPCPIFSQTQFGLSMAPKLAKPGGGGGGMFGQRQQPEPKAENGELTSLLRRMGIQWDNGEVVYDTSNPHPQFQTLPPEYVFVSRAGNRKEAFNRDVAITKGLQDIVCLFPGSVVGPKGSDTFTPLLQTSASSGRLQWEQVVRNTFNPMTMSPVAQINPSPLRKDDEYSHILACHVINEDKPTNVVFVTDIDMISDWFFLERSRGNLDLAFDNVSFILNAVDRLAAVDTFIALRSRRSSLRTLTTIEREKSRFREELNKVETEADEKMTEKLDAARKELQAEVDDITKRTDIDNRSKEQLLRQKEEQLNQELDAEERVLEQEKDSSIRKAALTMQRKIRRLENQTRILAYLASAILPICFGLLFLGLSNLSERQSIAVDRRR